MSTIRDDPDKCAIREFVPKEKLADWQPMSATSAIAFKKFVGKKMAPNGELRRKGNRIFVVGDAELALCVYNHDRQF